VRATCALLTPSPTWLLPDLSLTGPASSPAEPTQGADEMTTSQTYQADEDQPVQAHDQAISGDKLVEPEASLAAPEPDLTEPDADRMAPDADLTEPDADLMAPDADLTDLAEPYADRTAHGDLTPHQAGAVALADNEPSTSMMSGYPGLTPDRDSRAQEPEMPDSSPGSPSLVTVDFTVPESVADSHPADTARAAGPWNDVQAMFVDDPRASIERAAGLVDERVEELMQSVRDRQRSMQSAWQADHAGTEELRVALQQYRSFWNSLEDLLARH
jgi:hypothetical protein